ncbi:MAG: hypothetical protein IKJ39_11165 [Lachnospiraceae bacterium]|nr:hypothetical protein [Lachnospiraceae bacterium]
MKKKIYLGILIFEAIVCVIFCVLGTISGENVADMMVFPFATIGKGLRALSLSGSVGNIVAIILYGGISLLPLGLVLFHAKKKILHAEDILLVALCPLLFAVLYEMINPGSIIMGPEELGMLSADVRNGMLGCIVYSLLVGYLVLCALRLFFCAEKEKLQSYVSLMLGLLNMILVYMIFGACLQKFLQTMESTKAANQGTEDGLTLTYVILVLQMLTDALPYVLDMVIVFACQHMLQELQKDAYSEETMEAAGKLTRVCGMSLKVTILSIAAFNILQLLCAKHLRVINGFVNIPILSIVLVLTALLVAKLVTEGKKLKDDNDMFI